MWEPGRDDGETAVLIQSGVLVVQIAADGSMTGFIGNNTIGNHPLVGRWAGGFEDAQ
jgi:hypothetical protein